MRSWLIAVSVSILSMGLFGGISAAGDKTVEAPELVYDGIPAKWDYYFLTDDFMETYTGDSVKEVCFDDDLLNNPNRFGQLKVGIGEDSKKMRLFKGGSDFAVMSKSKFLLATDHTGIHIIGTKYCRKSLRRAKHLLLDDDINRRKANRCYKRGDKISILTRFRSGLALCKIESINQWAGSVDIEALKAENETYEAAQAK